MANHHSGTASPTSSSGLASRGDIMKERDIDRQPSTIPDSQQTHLSACATTAPRKFRVEREEVSESVLSEGFSWPVKAPPRPGQFSERPNRQPSQQPQNTSRHFPQNGPASNTQLSPPRCHVRAPAQRRALPLDLSEIGLPGLPTPSQPRRGRVLDQEASQLESPIGTGNQIQSLPKAPEKTTHRTPSKSGSKSGSKAPRSDNGRADCPSMQQPSLTKHHATQKALGLDLGPRAFSSRDIDGPTNAATPIADANHNDGEILRGTLSPQDDSDNLQDNYLNKLKLPLPHIARIGQNNGRSSPRSACGDLEVPVVYTPRSVRVLPCEYINPSISRPVAAANQREKSVNHGRSQSRASNISRKRSVVETHRPAVEQHRSAVEKKHSTAQKHRSRSDSERKKAVAMRQMAEKWNECIRIAEEEKNEANCAIEALQLQIRQQEETLAELHALLSERECQIEQAEAHCRELEVQQGRNDTEKHQLNHEVKLLREQVSESKRQVTGLVEKSRTFRAKINEAIAEQQQLYSDAQALYSHNVKELGREREKQEEAAQAFNQLLQESSKKNAELRGCLEESRIEAERENKKKDELISALKSRLANQKEELCREQDASIKLRREINQQATILDSVSKIESEVQGFIKASQKREIEEMFREETAAQLFSKIDSLMDLMQASTQAPVAPTVDLDPIVEKLEKKLISRLLPAVLTVVSGQTQAEESILRLRDDVTGELELIKHDAIKEAERRSRDRRDAEAAYQNLLRLLGRVITGSSETHQACQRTEQQLTKWTECTEAHIQMQKKSDESLKDEILQQLKEREAQIRDMEGNLQLLTDKYASKVEEMRTLILESDQEAKEYLQKAVSEIQSALEAGFAEERARSERNLALSEAARRELEGQLNAAREQLETTQNLEGEPNTTELQQHSQDDQRTIIALRQKLVKFELEAQATKKLRGRWQRDIQVIDALKGQLKEIAERLPRVETADDRFRHMVGYSQMMSSTASYLAAERCWVKQQLGDKISPEVAQAQHADGPGAPDIGHAIMVGDLSNMMFPEPMFKGSTVPTHAISSRQEPGATNQPGQPGARRRVVIKFPPRTPSGSPPRSPFKTPSDSHLESPTWGPPRTPSPKSASPKSEWRREAAPTRSILKKPKQPPHPSQDTCSRESGPNRTAASHSQYNRPVMGRATPTGAEVKIEVIDQIRCGFVSQREESRDRKLPTVADFENAGPARGDQDDSVKAKRRSGHVGGVSMPSEKKVKIGVDSSQIGIPEGPRAVGEAE